MQLSHFEFDTETDRIGEGPLSEVYRATDQRLGRQVALKILRAHAEIDPKADTRFLREAKHASNLEHPNIARIYEYGEDKGTAFIAMEFLAGRTLDKILKDRTLGFEECLRIAGQVTSALAVVHARGLVHRDLKPGNIMVQDDGTVKLLDFGIARASDEATITQHGMLVGTVLYMSPEQVRGEDVELRSDIFSLGSVFYHIATGSLPFPGKSFPEVCMAILDGKPRRPSLVRSGFPPAFEEFIMHCLRPDPADRYADGAEAQGRLLEVCNAPNATQSLKTLRGKIALPPIRVDPDDRSELAAGLRRDIASALDRLGGITVNMIDGLDPPPGQGNDYRLRGSLRVKGARGDLDLTLEHLAPGSLHIKESWEHHIGFEDANEWTLQAALVRSTVRTVRKRLSAVTIPLQDTHKRHVQEALDRSKKAREILHRGTSKHLMAAVSGYRRALEADPFCAVAFAGLAEAMVRKYLYWDGDTSFLDEARDHVARALALDPQCALAHSALGFSYQLSGHAADAQREYRLAIQADNTEWLAHRLLGAMRAHEGNFKEASALLRRSIGLASDHIGSYDHLFGVLQRLDRYEESLELADRGIAQAKAHLKTARDNQEARTHMAMLMARMGLTGEAHDAIEEARQISPKDGYTAYHAGCVYALLGDVDEAIEALRQALARGFFSQSELATNPDLDLLRGLEEFEALR